MTSLQWQWEYPEPSATQGQHKSTQHVYQWFFTGSGYGCWKWLKKTATVFSQSGKLQLFAVGPAWFTLTECDCFNSSGKKPTLSTFHLEFPGMFKYFSKMDKLWPKHREMYCMYITLTSRFPRIPHSSEEVHLEGWVELPCLFCSLLLSLTLVLIACTRHGLSELSVIEVELQGCVLINACIRFFVSS